MQTIGLTSLNRATSTLEHLVAWGPLVLIWAPARHFIEAHMVLHMMFEFPMLLASGWASHRLVRQWTMVVRLERYAEVVDFRGWLGALVLLLVAMTWMVPTMLDLSLLEPAVAAAKYSSWWATGWLLACSLRRMDPEGVLFTTGNLAWMMGTAGLLYLDSEQRLCVNYLWNDQELTGYWLVAAAGALGVFAFSLMLAGRPQAPSARDLPSLPTTRSQHSGGCRTDPSGV